MHLTGGARLAAIAFLLRVVREALRSAGLPESTEYPSGIPQMPFETAGFQLTELPDRVRVTWVAHARPAPGPVHAQMVSCLVSAGLHVECREGSIDVLPGGSGPAYG